MSRIGIDLRIVHFARSGFHRYARGLLWSLERALRPEIELVLLRHPEDRDEGLQMERGQSVAIGTPLFTPDEAAKLEEETRTLGLDAVHFPFSLLPGRVADRVTLTIHDLTCRRAPETIEEPYRSFYRRSLAAAATADRVLAVSSTVARELLEVGVSANQLATCPPLTPFEMGEAYFTPASTETKPPVDMPYVLAVGSIEPRKNLVGILDAYEHLRRVGGQRVGLVLCGAHGWSEGPFIERLGRHPFRSDITLVRDANDAVLRELLRGCLVFVQMSLYEGFGLPVLEALYEGACVLSTRVPSLTEGGFPAAGWIEADQPAQAGARLAALVGDADERARLAEESRALVGETYRALDPCRFSAALEVA